MFAPEFAAAVKRVRVRLNLTQQALALASGLSRQTVAQVESGAFSDLGVRKVERMLSVLGLSLAIAEGPDGIAPVRGAGSRLGRLLAGRALERRRRALALAARTLQALGREGVSACIVGSLAKGTFRAGSDVDYLVEDRGGVPESRVMAIVEASMKGFAFDVTFADRADPRLLAMMREEARGGTPAVRPA
jgi:transcriptional regulator with XRE-family HTH domain